MRTETAARTHYNDQQIVRTTYWVRTRDIGFDQSGSWGVDELSGAKSRKFSTALKTRLGNLVLLQIRLVILVLLNFLVGILVVLKIRLGIPLVINFRPGISVTLNFQQMI